MYNLTLNLFIMKKCTLLLTLLIASIGFSQQREVLIDFDGGWSVVVGGRQAETGCFEGVHVISFSNAYQFGMHWQSNTFPNRKVAELKAYSNGESWQGAIIDYFSTNIDLTTDKTMTMDVYSESAIDFAVKVTGGLSAPDSTTDFSHTGSGWETLTATFNKGLDNTAIANGVYSQIVIFQLWDSSTNNFLSPPVDRTFYIDNITGVRADLVVLAKPTTDAPTPPARLATDVFSIFSSNSYISGTNYNPDWQQTGLFYFQDISDNCGFKDPTKVQGDFLAYTYFNYQGIEFNFQDASEMDYFHLDVWTDTPGAVLRVSPINDSANGGTGVPELLVNVPLVNAGWSSVDIPKSSFSGMTWDRLHQLKFSGETGTTPSNIYLDNIYFWNAPPGPTLAVSDPPPLSATDVISIYSDTYTSSDVNFNPGWGQTGFITASYDPTASGTNNVLAFMDFSYQAIEFNTLDASAMGNLHLDVWTDTPGAVLRVSPINDNANGRTGISEFFVNVPLVNSGWSSVDIPKSSFSGMTWDKLHQLRFSGETGTTPSNIYLDNIYFWDGSTAGNDNHSLSSVKMHPNPASEGILNFSTVSNEVLDVSVYNLLGKQVLRATNVQSQLNISSLNPGLYFVNMRQGSSVSIQKLLVN